MLLASIAAACATAPSATSVPTPTSATISAPADSARPTPAPRSRNRELILASEIVAANLQGYMAREIIDRLRPEFLRARASTSIRSATRPFAVVVNGEDHGGLEVLPTIPGRTIARIQYMSGVEATERLPVRNRVGAAIVITLK